MHNEKEEIHERHAPARRFRSSVDNAVIIVIVIIVVMGVLAVLELKVRRERVSLPRDAVLAQ